MSLLRRAPFAVVFVVMMSALLFAGGSSQAERRVDQSAVPAFVRWLPAPAASETRRRDVANGLYLLLDDLQILSTPDRLVTFSRQAHEVTDRGGLEAAARIEVEYDPSYERLSLHRVAVVRDGIVQDRTKTTRLDLLRRESRLKDGIMNGLVTAVAQLSDVQVGDVVDISWSWDGASPQWPDHLSRRIDLGWSSPIGVLHARITRSGSAPLRIKRLNGARAPQVERLPGGETAYSWRIEDPEPAPRFENAPAGWTAHPYVDVSSIPSWGEVVKRAMPRYAPGALPSEFAAKIDAIGRRTSDPGQRAVAALRLVQDEVRYTSLSIGLGSVQPRDPAEVARSRFGDCKDKARLLVTALRRLGVTAWPALTDSDEGAKLVDRLPSESIFDHVIVGVEIAGRIFWVDPTQDRQGGSLQSQADLPYRYALPLKPGQTQLQPVPWRPDTAPTLTVVEHYAQSSNGMSLVVTTDYLRDEADIKRRGLAQQSRTSLERESLAYYAKRYAGIEMRGSFAIRDDRAANRLTVRERYFIPAKSLTNTLLAEFQVNAYSTADLFKLPKSDIHDAPLVLPYPLNRLHRIVLETPGRQPTAPDAVVIDNAAFRSEVTVKREGSKLEAEFRLFGKRPVLAAKDLLVYKKDVDTHARYGAWTLDLTQEHAFEALGGFVLLAIAIGLGLAGYMIWRERRTSAAAPVDEHLYPVPVTKFAVLSVGTWGLYALWWQWRNWRRIAAAVGSPMHPFWRAFFSILYLYPLFKRANLHARHALPLWLGAAAALGYFTFTVASIAAEEALPTLASVLGYAAPLLILPAVIAVNRSNQAVVVARNGRWSMLSIVGLAIGTFTIVSVELAG